MTGRAQSPRKVAPVGAVSIKEVSFDSMVVDMRPQVRRWLYAPALSSPVGAEAPRAAEQTAT